MMQRKKLKLLLASLATSTILCSTPLLVIAAGSGGSPPNPSDVNPYPNFPDFNLSNVSKPITITQSTCGDNCEGHEITNTSTSPSNMVIKVTDGTHKLILKDVNIQATGDASPLWIGSDAKVTLQIDGNVTLDNTRRKEGAGLQVDNKSSLIITGTGTLNASGADGGAGIGGHMYTAGDITIQGNPTINARGGAGAAGIGSGYRGGCANVTIKGGTVTAIGGGPLAQNGVTQDGSAGIGHGQNPPSSGGNVIISGGTVTAIGGQKKPDPQKAKTNGIQCDSLTSSDGSGEIYTNTGIQSGISRIDKLNAITWIVKDETDKSPEEGEVWGDATLDRNIDNTKLYLRQNSTLTIPKRIETSQLAIYSRPVETAATNKIFNSDYIGGNPYIEFAIKEYVTLSNEDVNSGRKENLSLPYTGYDLTADALVVNETRDSGVPSKPYLVDQTGWLPFISKDSRPEDSEMKILGAGYYSVTYRHENFYYNEETDDISQKYDDEFTLPYQIIVTRAKLADCKFDVETLTYTGTALQPKITASFNGQSIETPENEFTPTWDKDYNAGTHQVTLTPTQTGNFDDPDVKLDYTIKPALLDNAEIKIDPKTSTYDGTKHEPTITITIPGKNAPLKLDTDYTLSPSGGDSTNFTNAGAIIYSIKGKGNYDGTKEIDYTITPEHITIKSDKISAIDKDYDGNGEVTLEGVDFDGLVSADKGKVKLKSKGIVDEKNEGHAGTYKSVHLDKENIELIYEDGTPCGNYIVDYDGEELALSKDVTINKVTPEKRQPNHVDPYVVNANGTTFDCTIQIKKQPGVDYQFKMDGEPSAEEGWVDGTNSEDKTKSSAVFTAINAAKDATDKHIFYVRSKGTNDVVQEMMLPYELVFEKLKNPKADVPAFELSINEGNADKKTYTVTIPKVDDPDVEYRIITVGSEEDVPYNPTVVDKTDCKPGTKYIGQIRYKETPVYKASEPVSSPELTTPKSPLADSGPKYKTTWKRIIPNQSDSVEVPETLQAEGYTSMQEITTDLTRHLAGLGAYQDQEHTAFYDVKVQVITRNDAGEPETRDAEPGDFENGGIPVTLPAKSLPQGVVATENQFSAAHMFESEDFAEYSAGEIETCLNSEGSEVFQGSGKGVTFVVNGTSPVGIAWSTAPEEPTDPEDPNNPNNPEDPNNPDNNDPNNPDGNDPNNPNGTDPNNPDGNNGDANAADPNANNAADPNAANANGTDANGEDAKSAAQSAVDALKSAAASLLPKTGDTSKIIMWVVAAVAACIAVIAVLRSKAKKGKKAKSSSSAKTSATVKKPAATTAKKSASTTAKKTTTKKPASGTAKKTTTTKKGR